jgi:hypothetical protein
VWVVVVWIASVRRQVLGVMAGSSSDARIKNIACVKDIAKVMRAELTKGLEHSRFLVADESVIADHYCDFVCSLLEQTPRPIVKGLQAAAVEAFQSDEGEAKAFASSICHCISFCRIKGKSMTSGAKVSSGVKAIVAKLKSLKDEPAQDLPNTETMGKRFRKRTLQRYRSNESADGQPSEPPNYVWPSTTQQIQSLYNCSSGSMDCGHPEEIVSSQDVDLTAEEPTSKKDVGAGIPWLDRKALCMKRVSATGDIISSKMYEGTSGWAMAQFFSEDSFVTEMPNIMLRIVKKRPAAAIKRPAAASKRPAAAHPLPTLESDSEEEQEEEEEEEAEGEEEGGEEENEEEEEGEEAVGAIEVPVVPASGAQVPWKTANFTFEALVWGHCRAEFYTEKSYIRQQVIVEGKPKWVSIVSCQAKDGDHHGLLQNLVGEVKKGASKKDIWTLKASLMAEDIS